MYDAAPDMASLVIEGLEEKPASGFVALDKLLGAGGRMGPNDFAAPPSRRLSGGLLPAAEGETPSGQPAGCRRYK